MNSIFNTKENLQRLLHLYKNILSKEMFEYLNSLIELEFSVFDNQLSKKDMHNLANNNFYYNVALYNIYQRIMNIIFTMDVLPSLTYTEKSNTRSYYETLLINGIYIPKNYKKATEYPLISIDYNFKEDTKILINLFKKEIPINTDISKLSKEEKESIITNELVNRVLEDYKIKETDLEEEFVLKRTNKKNNFKTYRRENITITQKIN